MTHSFGSEVERAAGLVLRYPTSREKRARYPDFLYAAPIVFACAAFCEESRMKSANANRLHRKSGGMGHPGFAVRT
jgi:hypothetical protein